MKKENILTVKGLEIGQLFNFEDCHYRITKFPTRNTVCGENIMKLSGKPSSIKVPISKISYIPEHVVYRQLREMGYEDVNLLKSCYNLRLYLMKYENFFSPYSEAIDYAIKVHLSKEYERSVMGCMCSLLYYLLMENKIKETSVIEIDEYIKKDYDNIS